MLPGTYTVRITAPGYETTEVGGVTVPAEGGTILDAVLQPLPTATVTGQITSPDPISPIAGATVELWDSVCRRPRLRTEATPFQGSTPGAVCSACRPTGMDTIEVERDVTTPAVALDFALAPLEIAFSERSRNGRRRSHHDPGLAVGSTVRHRQPRRSLGFQRLGHRPLGFLPGRRQLDPGSRRCLGWRIRLRASLLALVRHRAGVERLGWRQPQRSGGGIRLLPDSPPDWRLSI